MKRDDARSRPPAPSPRATAQGAWRAAVADALGFVIGGMIGWLLGRALGWDFVGSPHWGAPQLLGLLTILAGMGACRWLARRLLLGRGRP